MTFHNDPTKYVGISSNTTSYVVRNRIPTSADYRQPETGKLYPLFCGWQVSKNPINGVEGDLYLLSKIVANSATWVKVDSTGGGGGDVVGPNSSITNNFSSFSDGTGKVIQDSGFNANNFLQVGNDLSDLSDINVARDNLNLGSLALQDSPLDVFHGGTGITTFLQGDILYSPSVNNLSALNIGSNGQILSVLGGLPTWINPPSGSGDVVGPVSSIDDNIVLFNGSSGKIIKDSGRNLNEFLQVSSNLADLNNTATARNNLGLGSAALINTPISTSNGGTGQTTYALGDLLVGNNANTLIKLSAGVNGQLLAINSSGSPEWINPPSGSGDVVGPSSSIDSNFVVFDGTSGKIVKDLGVNSGYFLSRQNGMVFLKSNVIDGKVLANHLAFTNVDKFIYAGVYIDWFDVSVVGDAIISLRIGFTPGSNNLFGESFKLRNLLYDNQATYNPSRTRSEVITGITRVIPQGSNVYISVTQAASSATTCNFVMYLTGFYA